MQLVGCQCSQMPWKLIKLGRTPAPRSRKLSSPFIKRDRLVKAGFDFKQAESVLELLEEFENELESVTAAELKHSINRISSKLNVWLVILIAFDIVAAAPHATPESMLGKILAPLISILY